MAMLAFITGFLLVPIAKVQAKRSPGTPILAGRLFPSGRAAHPACLTDFLTVWGTSPGLCRKRSRLTGLLSRRNTASHRSHRTQGAPPSPPRPARNGAHILSPVCLCVCASAQQKTEAPDGASEKNHSLTSYGGITRIRFKGRSLRTSSQPATQAPPFFPTIYPGPRVCQFFFTDFPADLVSRRLGLHWPRCCGGASKPAASSRLRRRRGRLSNRAWRTPMDFPSIFRSGIA